MAKWVLSGEPNEDKAAKLKEDHLSGISQLSAPSFMIQEVANSLWKAIKRKRITQEYAREALQMLNDLKIELENANWLRTSEALTIACNLDLTVYDAAYLFLAKETEACLITADNKLYEKVKGYYKILHVKDYL